MARLVVETPSSGKTRPLFIPSTVNAGTIPTDWYTLVEANDYSVDSQGDPQEVPDPARAGRILKPGVIRFLAPLLVSNNSALSRWIELQVVTENGTTIRLGRIIVPANEAVNYPIQGQHLAKFDFAAANGSRLNVRAEVGDALQFYGTCVESGASDHVAADI